MACLPVCNHMMWLDPHQVQHRCAESMSHRCDTLESTLPKPSFPLQNHPKHHWKHPRTEGGVTTKEDELLERRKGKHQYSLSKPPWLFPGKSQRPLRVLIQNPCNRRRWILHDRSFPTIPILAGFHNVEQEIWAKQG